MAYVIGSIIIFMIVIMIFMSRSAEDKLLKGFWRADADFCDRAELEMFVLYLGDDIGYIKHCRNGYLLAANKGGFILNNPIKLTLSGNVNILPGMAKTKNYNASIDWLESEPEDPNAFPSEFQAAYYPAYGKLVLYQDDEVLASLWKDSQMSALTSDEALIPNCIDCSGDSTNEYEDL
jgi:hypothetical protein